MDDAPAGTSSWPSPDPASRIEDDPDEAAPATTAAAPPRRLRRVAVIAAVVAASAGVGVGAYAVTSEFVGRDGGGRSIDDDDRGTGGDASQSGADSGLRPAEGRGRHGGRGG